MGLLPPAWCFPTSAYMPSCPLWGLGILQGLASDSPLLWEAFLKRGGKVQESVGPQSGSWLATCCPL